MFEGNRYNGYWETDRGVRNAALMFKDREIAHTDDDVIYAFNREHEEAIKEWANEYGYMIIWLCH